VKANSALQRTRRQAASLSSTHVRVGVVIILAAWLSLAGAEDSCLAVGEPVQWVADYCMLKMETDDEMAVAECIEVERKTQFPSACASNAHFKKLMCEQMIRNGTKSGTIDRCVEDPAFKGRTVEKGGVGA
jgi:hypothetical protein